MDAFIMVKEENNTWVLTIYIGKPEIPVEKSMFCAIPLEISENLSCDSEWCNFSTLVSLFS